VLDHSLVREGGDTKTVRIYSSADQVPGRYDEIGLLSSRGNALSTNERGMMESMRRKAAELGANAIVVDAMSKPSTLLKIAAAVADTKSERRGKAVAIFVHPEGERVAQSDVAVAPQTVQVEVVAPAQAPSIPRSIQSALSDYNSVAAAPSQVRRTVCFRDAATGQFTDCRPAS